jgi:hypothetical protein
MDAVATWPPPWDPAAASPPAGGKDQLDYTQKLFAVVVIGLALPWLVKTLITNPSRVMAGAAHQHVKPR